MSIFSRSGLVSLLMIAILVLINTSGGAAAPPPPDDPAGAVFETVKLPPEALSLSDGLAADARASGNPKLGSSLNQLVEAHRREGLAEAQAYATSHGMVLQDGRVQVKIVTTEQAIGDVRDAVEAVGGKYQTHYQNLLQTLVPVGELEALAERPDVQIIREPQRAIPLAPVQVGSQTTEGVAASNALAWHAVGRDGTGVRVAVIDGGFTNYLPLLGTDLPGSVTTYDWTSTGMGGSPHGTACAEIVHDMAYGATMDLHRISTDVELGNAVAQAIADGVDIISMSLGWTIDGPGDGTGSLASIVNNARSNGIFYATAAGNDAQVSWSGTYVNYNPGTNDYHAWDGVNKWLNFMGPGDGTCYVYSAGFPIRAGLHWDDWTATNQDYDLHLYRWPGGSTVYRVASSTNWQNGGIGQTPEEFVSYTAAGGNCYAWVVERYSSTRNVCLRLIAPKTLHLDEWTPQRSLTFPADSADAITVGAVDVSSYNLESYSSRGPTFGSGGTCSGGSTEPDIAAFANVSTVSYGTGVFNGTSAATPHVAGAAALVKGAYPSYSVSQVQNYLENTAIDQGAAGKDNLYGWGRLYLGNPPGNPDLSIAKRVVGPDPDPGDPITFTLSIENTGPHTATNVVVTDTIPADITPTGWANSPSLAGTTEQGGTPYVWDLPDLVAGASGIISIYGTINSPLPPGWAIVNWATIATSDQETDLGNNSSVAIVGGYRVYLPLVLRNSQ